MFIFGPDILLWTIYAKVFNNGQPFLYVLLWKNVSFTGVRLSRKPFIAWSNFWLILLHWLSLIMIESSFRNGCAHFYGSQILQQCAITTELNALVIMWVVKNVHQYLHRHHYNIFTDRDPYWILPIHHVIWLTEFSTTRGS